MPVYLICTLLLFVMAPNLLLVILGLNLLIAGVVAIIPKKGWNDAEIEACRGWYGLAICSIIFFILLVIANLANGGR